MNPNIWLRLWTNVLIADLQVLKAVVIYIYGLFIPFSTLYMVLWVNTTRIILVEIMLQMFHHMMSRGPLSLFQLEFVSLSCRCSVIGWMFLCPSLGGDGVRGRDFMVLFLGSGLGFR